MEEVSPAPGRLLFAVAVALFSFILSAVVLGFMHIPPPIAAGGYHEGASP